MKDILPNYILALFTLRLALPMLRIEILNKDLNDEKINKLVSIVSAMSNGDQVEVVFLEEW